MGLKAVANPAAGGQPGSFTTLTVSGAATIGGGLAVTGSISASTGVSLGVNAPLQFTAGSGTAPYLQHTSNTLDVKQGTSGLRVLNNAGTVALLSLTDGTTTQMAVTGSISATDYIAGAEQHPPHAPAANGYRIFAQDNGAGKTQLMVIFASGAAQQIAIEP